MKSYQWAQQIWTCRSFGIKFEVNAFVYDENLAKDLRWLMNMILQNQKQLTEESYARPLSVKFKESLAQISFANFIIYL